MFMNTVTLHQSFSSDLMRILTVVETQFAARSIRENLENLEYEADAMVFSAPDAFAHLKKESFDLILLDAEWLKPGISALDFIENIRGSDSFNEIPVLICSAKSTTEDIKQALRAGASGYLLKPYSEETFKEHIEKFLVSA